MPETADRRPAWLARLVLTLALARAAVADASCLVEEPHLTLGDQFSLEQTRSTHFFTVGFMASDACTQTPPELQLAAADGQTKRLQAFASKSVDLQIPVSNETAAAYNKQGMFFRVSEADFAQFDTWAVYSGPDLLVGPTEFPSRWRRNLSHFRMFVVADMDLTETSAPTVQRIEQMAAQDFDFLVDVGDFAYEIEMRGGKQGDEFFAQMSKTTRRIPYLMSPGNHELFAGGKLLDFRFRMPNTEADGWRQNHFYDLVVKGAYFMVVDFDFLYIHKDAAQDPDAALFGWMQARLALLERRTDIGWKVFVSHRPFSCSDFWAGDCFVNMYYFRKYEDLLARHGFHFQLQAHLHTYTRSKPLSQLVPSPQSRIGSGAMVSIINGHSGTVHYFGQANDTERIRSDLLDAVDSSGPTYTLVEVSPERFQTQLVRADTGEIRDTFSIDRTTLDGSFGRHRRTWWVKYVILLAISCALGVLVAASYLHQKKREVSLVNAQLRDVTQLGTYQKVPTDDWKAQVSLKAADDALSGASTKDSPDRKSPHSATASPLN